MSQAARHLTIWPVDIVVYLHRAPVDFRKQINGLVVLVSESMQSNVFKPALYVFTNSARNRVKVLYWDGDGFCLWLKRLEKARFIWPVAHASDVLKLSGDQLNWLIGGYDIFRFPPNEVLSFDAIT